MAKATPEQTRKANKAALAVSFIVALFAVLFIGAIWSLDSMAGQRAESEVVIAEEFPSEPFYVLLIGSDTRKGTALYTGRPTEHGQADQRSDVMTLMRVDPNTYTISLLTIPRDTVLDESGEKINNALLGNDPEQVIDVVHELTGLKADYYMMVTFGTFAKLIDAIGGIVVDVPTDVTANDPTTGSSLTVKAGSKQKLNGSKALVLARARAEYGVDQDAYRQASVRDIEEGIINRMLSSDSISIEALLVALEEDVETNIDLPIVGLTIKDFMENSDEVTIYSGTGPYAGDVRAEDNQWVIQNDRETWKKIIRLFKRGRDFTHVVEPPEELQVPEEESSSASSSAGASSSANASSSSSSATSSSGSSGKSGSTSASNSSSGGATANSSAGKKS